MVAIGGWALVWVGEHPTNRFADGEIIRCIAACEARTMNADARRRGSAGLQGDDDTLPFSALERSLFLIVPVTPLRLGESLTPDEGAGLRRKRVNWRAVLTEATEAEVLDRRQVVSLSPEADAVAVGDLLDSVGPDPLAEALKQVRQSSLLARLWNRIWRQ